MADKPHPTSNCRFFINFPSLTSKLMVNIQDQIVCCAQTLPNRNPANTKVSWKHRPIHA